MPLCSDQCEIELLSNPLDCAPAPRLKTPARFLFYSCATSIPEDAEAIEQLITDGLLVMSSKLSNVTFNDPVYQEFPINDCQPNQRAIASREVTFQDRQALIGSGGSPAAPIPYFDFDFWNRLISNSPSLNVMIMYCDGDVTQALDANGNPLSVDLSGFVNYDTASTPGAKRPEFKQFSAIFNGDPLAFTNKPFMNYNELTGEVTLLS